MIRLKHLFLIFFVAQGFNLFAFEPKDTIIYKKAPIENFKSKIIDAPIVIKTSPTAFLWGGLFPYTSEYRLMAEITTGRTQSEQVSFSFIGKGVLLKMIERSQNYTGSEVLKVNGWRVQYAHKFYLIKKKKFAPSGFYFGPLLSYSDIHISLGLKRYYNKTYYDFRNFNANLMIGLQAAKKKRIAFDLYGAIGYKSNKAFYHANSVRIDQLDTSDYGAFYTTNLNLTFGINLGYSF